MWRGWISCSSRIFLHLGKFLHFLLETGPGVEKSVPKVPSNPNHPRILCFHDSSALWIPPSHGQKWAPYPKYWGFWWNPHLGGGSPLVFARFTAVTYKKGYKRAQGMKDNHKKWRWCMSEPRKVAVFTLSGVGSAWGNINIYVLCPKPSFSWPVLSALPYKTRWNFSFSF